jgi:hypothetical protein
VDPDLSRRLRRYGGVVDAAAQAADARRADGTSSANASHRPEPDARPVVQVGRRPPRWYTLLATAAAVLAVVGGFVIADAVRSPSTPTGEQPLATEGAAAVLDSTEPAVTTEAPRPTTAIATPTTSAPPTTEGTAATTRPTEPGPCPDGYRDPGTRLPLRLCDRGERVRAVQQRLTETSAAGLLVDGYFGPTTRQAVRVFQEQHGLEVDGLVGPDTMAALFPTSAASSTASGPGAPNGP